MAAPFKKKRKVLLEKHCEFAVGIRGGRVLELRPEGYLVFWEEWTDPETGECHKSTGGVISYDAIVTENSYGNLKILRRPLAKPFDPKRIRRVERLPAEIARQRFKKQYVLAIQEMIDDGDLELIRDDFCDKIIELLQRAKGVTTNTLPHWQSGKVSEAEPRPERARRKSRSQLSFIKVSNAVRPCGSGTGSGGSTVRMAFLTSTVTAESTGTIMTRRTPLLSAP